MTYDHHEMVIMPSSWWEETRLALENRIDRLRENVSYCAHWSGVAHPWLRDAYAGLAVICARYLAQARFAYLRCGGTDARYCPAGYGR